MWVSSYGSPAPWFTRSPNASCPRSQLPIEGATLRPHWRLQALDDMKAACDERSSAADRQITPFSCVNAFRILGCASVRLGRPVRESLLAWLKRALGGCKTDQIT